MYTAVLFCALFLLPIFHAEDQQDMYIPHAIAARYLFGSSLRRLGNVPMDSASIYGMTDQNSIQQRGKRIYWENLAFHASDFNRKTKKFGRYMY